MQNSDSKSCGEFVIYFLINRLHNKDIELEDLLNYIFEFCTTENPHFIEKLTKVRRKLMKIKQVTSETWKPKLQDLNPSNCFNCSLTFLNFT